MQLNTTLWSRINDFDLYQDHLEYGFAARLMKAQNWTRRFTESAILEYKKFMYMAAVSESMVSPSEIIDEVWHQHLIFSDSYMEFCKLLGKTIHHIPSTGNAAERQRFKEARTHTQKMYNALFGNQDPLYWSERSPDELTGIKELRISQSTFHIAAAILLVPVQLFLYFTIGKLYPHIPSSVFLPIIILMMIGVSITFYRVSKARIVSRLHLLPTQHYLNKLTETELLYFKTANILYVIQCFINESVQKGILKINPISRKLEMNDPELAQSPEERAICASMEQGTPESFGILSYSLNRFGPFYSPSRLVEHLREKVFHSQFIGSTYQLMFVLNYLVISLAFIRIMTGIAHGKPVGFIILITILGLGLSIYQLYRFRTNLFTQAVCRYYETLKKVDFRQISTTNMEKYYTLKEQVFDPMLLFIIPTFLYPENHRRSDGDGNGGSGCGSSCGSSCGGGCGGGCGGCGG